MKKSSQIRDTIKSLKAASGTHSPSIATILNQIPELEIKVDACFLSNPYATDLFMDRLDQDLVRTQKLRRVLEFYPPQAKDIAKKISRINDIDPDRIFVTNGAIEAIQAIMHTFVGKKICVVLPTFSSYYEFARPDTEVVFYQLDKDKDYVLKLDSYIAFLKKNNVDSVVLINPNNPDGGYIPKKHLIETLSILAHLQTIVLDESFIHYASEDSSDTKVELDDLVNQFPNIIVVKSMSKDFGVAGLRAGFALMSRERVAKLFSNGYLWNVSGLADYFFDLYAQVEFQNQYEKVRRTHLADTREFLKDLQKLPHVKVYPSSANFALLELEKSSFDFTIDMLVDFGIYVRDCADKRGLDGNFVRIAARTREENAHIVEAIKQIVMR